MKKHAAFHSWEEVCCANVGFTVLELLVVVAIVGILATLMVPQMSDLGERAQRVVCTGHLRSLHVSLGAYLNDNEFWPQCPDELGDAAAEQFWLDVLKEYGADEATWRCPTLARQLGASLTSGTSEAPRLHYTPTQFDDNPLTPRKWAGQPWLIEIGDMHHCGNLFIRADGAVQTMNDALGKMMAGGG